MRMSLKSMPTFFMLSIARSLYIDAHTPCAQWTDSTHRVAVPGQPFSEVARPWVPPFAHYGQEALR